MAVPELDDISVSLPEKSNVWWKLYIALALVITVGLAGVSAWYIVKNKDLKGRLFTADEVAGDPTQMRAAPGDLQNLSDYTRWRLVQSYAATKLLDFRRAAADTSSGVTDNYNEEERKRQVGALVQQSLEARGFPQRSISIDRMRDYRGIRGSSSTQARRLFEEKSFKVSVAGTYTRRQILDALLQIQDENPFLFARDFELIRTDENDTANRDAWSFEVDFVYFNRLQGRSS